MHWRWWNILGGIAAIQAAVAATPPATQPDDSAVSWLLGQSTTAPSTAASDASDIPATRPTLLSNGDDPEDAPRLATMTLSDGQKLQGPFTTTPDQPLRVWVEAEKRYHDISFDQIKALEAVVVWERDEKEWKFAASGSDVKEYSGKTYPARQTQYTLTLLDGTSITGDVAAPLYLHQPDGNEKLFVLHKRDKGVDGQTLKDLVYIAKVEFTPS